jgi:hypothetical protein
MEDIEEVILALRAAGYSMPQYEILADGSYHFFTNPNDKIIEPKDIRPTVIE